MRDIAQSAMHFHCTNHWHERIELLEQIKITSTDVHAKTEGEIYNHPHVENLESKVPQ